VTSGLSPEPERIGRDGKSYPASKVTDEERRDTRRYYDEHNRKDVEDLKKLILKWFFVLPLRDQDEVMDLIDKFRTEKLERAE
jgi:hypothetical protein